MSNFDREDRLALSTIRFNDLSVAPEDLLDSDGDGTVNAADADVRQAGRNLVIDLDAMFGRATGSPLDAGDHHVVLVNLSGFDADQLI